MWEFCCLRLDTSPEQHLYRRMLGMTNRRAITLRLPYVKVVQPSRIFLGRIITLFSTCQVLTKRRLFRLSRKDISSTSVSMNTTHVDFRAVSNASHFHPSDNSLRWPFCCHCCKCARMHTHAHARLHAHAVPSCRSRCWPWASDVRGIGRFAIH